MAKKTYDVCTGRKYTTNQGEEKTAWTPIGKLFIKDDGKMSVKLEALPLPNEKGEVWLSVFEPRPKDGQQTPHNAAKSNGYQAAPPAIDDDIPF